MQSFFLSPTYIGPLNTIYVTYYTHGYFGIMDFLKKDTCDISVAEALVHGPILLI